MTILLCVLVYLCVVSAGPARAYVCEPGSSYPPRVASNKDCDQPRAASAWRKKGDADAMSFLFFIGAVGAVLLIPLAFGRREELPPQ